MGELESEQGRSILPTISEKTKLQVLEELGILDDERTRRIIAGIKGEIPKPLAERLEGMAERVFTDLLSLNRRLVEKIHKKLKALTLDPASSNRDSMIEGMAVVLRAYEIESGYNLISRMGQLTEEDMKVVESSIERSISPPQTS